MRESQVKYFRNEYYQPVASEDFEQQRLKDLTDNISQEQSILNQYEKALRYEEDPRKQAKYRRDKEQLEQSIVSYKQEYDELMERINRLKRIAGNQTNTTSRNQSSLKHSPLLFDLLLQIDF